ncbi:MAG TPA: hypothetical protein VD997_07715 [Phycisphaerales bacterium]|nr:hypothetical protein [Phycisphaerales bacterium]
MGWSNRTNGSLLAGAEDEFDLLITTDQSLRYQQNIQTRRIAILVLMTTRWPRIKAHTSLVAQTVDRMKPGEYLELHIPHLRPRN